MNFLLAPIPFILFIGGLYFLIGRKTTRADGAAFVLLVVAAQPLWDGTVGLFREYGRWDYGRVAPGVVAGKLSSTGEDGTRTIGGSRFSRPSRKLPYLVTSRDFKFHDVLARMVLTGSKNAWVVEYRYPCDTGPACFQREPVSRALWSELRVGQMVNVRRAKMLRDPGRLDANPQWPTALVKLAIGGITLLAAALVSGRLKLRRRRFVTVPAVVTSIEPVTSGETTHWRVNFAYFADGGAACESADIVYAPGLKPGDTCAAVYPADRPDLGTLRTV